MRRRFSKLQVGYVLLIMSSLVVMILITSYLWLGLGLGALMIIGMAAILREERILSQKAGEMRLVQVMNRHRHDWMNELQVLFGYIQLKKIDKLQSNVDKIIARIQQDTYISKLGIPSLIAYLLEFRVEHKAFMLAVELEQEIHLDELPVSVERLTRLICQTIDCFHECAIPSEAEPNELSIQFELEEEGSLLLDFVYSGLYLADQLKKDLHRIQKGFGHGLSVENEFSKDRAVVTIQLSFLT